MTKVLIFTNKNDITTDFIVKKLQDKGIHYFRLNTEDICTDIQITLDFSNKNFLLYNKRTNILHNILSFTDVYFRRPELPKFNKDNLSDGEINFLRTEVFFALEGIYRLLKDKHWFNSIFAIREAENKIYQLILAQQLGLQIPNSLISNRHVYVNDFLKSGDCIIKPIHNSRIIDPYNSKIIFTSEIKESYSIEETEYSLNFLQNKINKTYDIRATFVGEQCFAVSIDSQKHPDTMIDWRKGEHILKHTPIQLPDDIKKKCIQLMKALHLNYAAIDFVLDTNNNYIFLELNPNGQWAWIEHLTGLPISEEITKQLCRL